MVCCACSISNLEFEHRVARTQLIISWKALLLLLLLYYHYDYFLLLLLLILSSWLLLSSSQLQVLSWSQSCSVPLQLVSLASGHCLQEFYFECRSKKLRALRLQQYGMTDKERASLPACLIHNQFNKAAWKSWHASIYEDEQRSPAKVQLACLLLYPACVNLL